LFDTTFVSSKPRFIKVEMQDTEDDIETNLNNLVNSSNASSLPGTELLTRSASIEYAAQAICAAMSA
jgi:hypothetical protein